jgi:preprotein translocase subunit SecG
MVTTYYVLMVLFLVMCAFMTLLVLIQKGRGGGLSSAFGGAGGNTAFGTKTGDVLTWVTSVTFALFIILAVALNLVADKIGRPTAPTQPNVMHMPVGGSTPTAVPGAGEGAGIPAPAPSQSPMPVPSH